MKRHRKRHRGRSDWEGQMGQCDRGTARKSGRDGYQGKVVAPGNEALNPKIDFLRVCRPSDLDETLVHCSFSVPELHPDFTILVPSSRFFVRQEPKP